MDTSTTSHSIPLHHNRHSKLFSTDKGIPHLDLPRRRRRACGYRTTLNRYERILLPYNNCGLKEADAREHTNQFHIKSNKYSRRKINASSRVSKTVNNLVCKYYTRRRNRSDEEENVSTVRSKWNRQLQNIDLILAGNSMVPKVKRLTLDIQRKQQSLSKQSSTLFTLSVNDYSYALDLLL